MNADLLSLSPRELLSREETYTALSEADQSYLTADGLQHYVATHLPHLLHVAQQLPVELTDLTAIALTLLCGRGKDVEGDDDVRVEMDQWRPTINALTALGGYAEAIFSADVATLGVVLLARRSCVVPRVARLINRILLASLMMSYEETLKVMMMAISTEWMREVVRNLAKSNIISYTILTILDWAPSLHLFPDANTTTAHASENTVCGVWLANQFPHYVLEYLPMALNAREDADHTFFTFVREVIQGGLSPLRGPIADALLKNHQFSQMVEAVVVRCETDMRELSCTSCSHAPFMHSCAHVSMAGEGITLMVQSLHLLRSSLEGASTMEKYTSQIHASPISSLLPAMPRMVRVLHMEPIQEPMLSIRGPPKHVLCDVFLEVALLQRACTDTALVQSGFFGALFFLCERYPNREPLLHRLSKLVMHLFTRTLLMDAPMEVWMEQDVLLSAFLRPMTCNNGATNEGVTAATPAGPTSKLAAPTSSSSSSMSCLHRLIHYSISASYERHTLSTFSMALLYHLSASCPLFAQDGPLYHELEPFRRCARVRERLSCMNDELTGRHHHEKGSSCAAMAHHSPEINYATKRERIHQRQKSPILTLERFDEMEDVGSSGSTFFRAPPRTVVEEPMLDVAAMIDEQVALRSRGSPQVQAYPNFGTMSLGFSSGP